MISQGFSKDQDTLTALEQGIALSDRSSWGLLQLKGDDRMRFLHNQTTNNINALSPGKGCDTVFVTSTGRTIDIATVYLTEDSLLILVSPNRSQKLMEWMDRFIFPMDRVELADLSQQNAIFTLLGASSDDCIKSLGIESIVGQPESSHTLSEIEGQPVRVAVGTGLGIAGYTLIVPREGASIIWSKLITLGAIPLGEREWEQLRIKQGRPMPEQELTEDYNPLEAGLWKAISFEKGCYIGQETIARLNTYKGVKQRLWGIELSNPVKPGTPITTEEGKVGVLTSYTETEKGFFGMGYVRSKTGGSGLTLQVGEVSGKLVDLPFITHEYYQPNSPQVNP
jgi:folate-binding protein YgfZ